MKSISAICATSTEVKRKLIRFDEATGLILDVSEDKILADVTYGDECLLFAGMGDIHIHAREDVSQKNCYKEDFLSAYQAMTNGGVTHAGDMPNNPVPPVDDHSYAQKVKLGEKAHGSLWFYAGIGPQTKPLTQKVPYKVYMGPSIGELYFKDLKTLDETLRHYRDHWVSFHCEDPEILDAHKSEPTHNERRPVEAEVMATKDALALIQKYSLKGKLCHYSSGEGLELIRQARKNGTTVLIEATPQHLYFDQAETQQNIFFQMNPPIREKKDKEEMLKALMNGEIDYLATDHAPHTKEEKERGISGLTGLDTFGPFVTWLLIEKKIDPKLIARITAENPGDFYNQFLPTWKKLSQQHQAQLGHLKPNFKANFTILNLKRPMTVAPENLKTKVGHSPFVNVTFPGSIEALYIGGKKL